ncbi:MAG: hypothetical protein ACYC6L_12725 [Anaerolineae bacterium]
MSVALPQTAAQRLYDRQHLNEQHTASYQEQARKLGLDLVYFPGIRQVVVYHHSELLCPLVTVGELRMFLTGYAAARQLFERELRAIVIRLEANGINPLGSKEQEVADERV